MPASNKRKLHPSHRGATFCKKEHIAIVTEGNENLYILTLLFPLIPSYFLISPTCPSKILNFPPFFTKFN